MALYHTIASYPLLIQGFSRTQENDGRPGIDGVTIASFEADLGKEIGRLHQELINKTYKPSPLLLFERRKVGGGSRILSVATVRDRIVQSSAFIVLNPVIDTHLEDTSYAYRKGFSREMAARKINQLYRDGYEWIVDADICNFFGQINHDILLQRLADIVKEDDIIELVKSWIQCECVFNYEKSRMEMGIPQGLSISPILANLYLDKFDEELTEKGYKLVRYSDDFIILAKSKPQAEKALQVTQDLLADLELELNPEKTHITSFDQGFKYLGYLFVRSLVMSASKKDTSKPDTVSEYQDTRPGSKAKTTLLKHLKALDKKETADTSPPPAEDSISPKEIDVEASVGQSLLQALQVKGISLDDFIKDLAENKKITSLTTDESLPDEDLFVSEEDIINSGPSEQKGIPTPEKPAPQANVNTKVLSLKRTLYIQEQGTVLSKESNRFVILKDSQELLDIPSIKVHQIVIFGTCTITPAVMQFCLYSNIPIILLSSRGKYFGRIESGDAGNSDLERLQLLRTFDASFTHSFAKDIIRGKLTNQKVLLQRSVRRRRNSHISDSIEKLKHMNASLKKTLSIDTIRGYEGRSAALYFQIFGRLFDQSTPFYSENFKRIKRPPTDPINSMLSFGYTLLSANIISFLRSYGLNPYIGYFHALRQGHPALASDLIEEFRHCIDSLVVQIINKHILTDKDFYFVKDPYTPCYMTNTARKEFVRQFELRMSLPTTHPETGVKADYRRCIDLQVRQLTRVIKGEKYKYKPFTLYF